MQIAKQEPEQGKRGNPNWVPGVSANPAGRMSNAARQERIEAKARELAVEFGGIEKLSPVERALLDQAAVLLLRKPRSAEDVVRVANSVQRLLGALGKRKGRREPEHVPLRERLGGGA